MNNSSRSPRNPALVADPDGDENYKGVGVKKIEPRKKHPPNSLYRFDERYFRKINPNPALFQLAVDAKDYDHLKNDDLDRISKLEVTYKIMKQQMRNLQAELIEERESLKRSLAQARMAKKARQRSMKPIDMNKFARHIKHFELYGAQRDMDPELKRIVDNLMCQKHKYMYCPCCKQYEGQPIDPVENVQKFLDYVRDEQTKLHKRKMAAQRLRWKKRKEREKNPKFKKLEDDSASDITYLEEEEILAKYYDETMTLGERKAKERKIVQARLYAVKKPVKHDCDEKRAESKASRRKRVATPKPKNTIKVELREAEEHVSMYDESNSAHQFSLKNASIQCDKEDQLEAQMQTSEIIYHSAGDQYVNPEARSMSMQASEIEFRSGVMQTSLFGPNAPRAEMETQTDPRYTKIKTPERRNRADQTERLKDLYREDWAHSRVFKRALITEAENRRIPTNTLGLSESEDTEEEHGATTSLINRDFQSLKSNSQEHVEIANAQDPDTATEAPSEINNYNNQMQIGFMKDYRT